MSSARTYWLTTIRSPYRDEVVHYLDLIATTDVGRTLYAFLGKPAKTVRITWTLGTSWLLTGATSISKSDVDRVAKAGERIARERRISIQAAVDAAFEEDAIIRAKTRGQYAKGHPVMQEIFISVFETLGLHSTFQFPTLETGTGEGIDVELDYHPAAFGQITKNTGRIGIGMGPGEALYHELVHALRMMEGAVLSDNVPERWNMDSFEEFCSIVAANMYRSARGFSHLRLDHRFQSDDKPWRGPAELPAELTDSARYYKAFKPEIDKWFNTQRPFCLALAGSCAKFNPMAVAADELGLVFIRC